MKNKTIALILLTVTGFNQLSAEEMPIQAKAGQCFTKAFFPPKYGKTIRTTSTKRVQLSESTVKYKVIPPLYSWHEERVKISEGKEKIITIPAQYKTLYEKILIAPEQRIWRRGLKSSDPKAFNSCVEAASKSGMDTENAQAGTCFYEHFQPERYRTTTEKILSAEASQRIVAIPAKYRTGIKKVMTENSTQKLIPVPIKYKKVQEKILIAPARSEWRKTVCQDRGCNQSEVVCLVEIPKTYKTITKKVILKPAVTKKVTISPVYTNITVEELVQPASSKVIPIPAKYTTISQKEKVTDAHYSWTDASSSHTKTRIYNECDKICLVTTPAQYKRVAKKIVTTPASSKKVVSPPKYTNIKIRKVEREASFETITVPAEYKEVTVERERTKGYAKWMPVVCESNMTPTLVRKVQEALQQEGFYHGEIDGKWSIEAKSATRAYQKANGLSVTRLSIETMKSLNIY